MFHVQAVQKGWNKRGISVRAVIERLGQWNQLVSDRLVVMAI